MNPLAWLLLVGLWLLAWGHVSVANVVSGAVLAAVVLLVFSPRRRGAAKTRLRFGPALRLAGHVAVQLVRSNLLVTREILARGSRVRTGVIAHPMANGSDQVTSLVVNIIALSPGTMVVDVTEDPTVIYVHCLLLDDVDAARRSIDALEQRVAAAVVPAGPSVGGPT